MPEQQNLAETMTAARTRNATSSNNIVHSITRAGMLARARIFSATAASQEIFPNQISSLKCRLSFKKI
jgi:hypothetical protein